MCYIIYKIKNKIFRLFTWTLCHFSSTRYPFRSTWDFRLLTWRSVRCRCWKYKYNFKWPSIYWAAFPIPNNTHKSFICIRGKTIFSCFSIWKLIILDFVFSIIMTWGFMTFLELKALRNVNVFLLLLLKANPSFEEVGVGAPLRLLNMLTFFFQWKLS